MENEEAKFSQVFCWNCYSKSTTTDVDQPASCMASFHLYRHSIVHFLFGVLKHDFQFFTNFHKPNSCRWNYIVRFNIRSLLQTFKLNPYPATLFFFWMATEGERVPHLISFHWRHTPIQQGSNSVSLLFAFTTRIASFPFHLQNSRAPNLLEIAFYYYTR